MDFPEIILPIVAGFLFANFHFFLKKAKDKILIQCIGRAITGTALLLFSMFFENYNITSSAIWLLLITVSVIIHSIASKVISIAYSYSNISLSLPIAKGCSFKYFYI